MIEDVTFYAEPGRVGPYLLTAIQRAVFTESLHPRDKGKFSTKSGSGAGGKSQRKVAAGKGKSTGHTRARSGGGKSRASHGNLSFDGKRGAGYGTPGGDKRVHTLQNALNRLGFTDAKGEKLKGDGKLGPKTTAAIKRAQRAMGLKPDGVVTPALLRKLSRAKSAKDLAPKKKAPKKVPAFTKVAPKKTARPSAPASVNAGR